MTGLTDTTKKAFRNTVNAERLRSAICKIFLKCDRESWMVTSDTFLGLPKGTSPELLFKILGNSRLSGCPPGLEIHNSVWRKTNCWIKE